MNQLINQFCTSDRKMQARNLV